MGGARTEESLRRRETQLAAANLGPGIEFEFRRVRDLALWFDSHHDWLLQDLAYLAAGIGAEGEGYDAVCVDTVSDQGVNALRSVLTIPVIGAGRASYLMALMLGNKFSILTLWDPWKGIYEKSLVEYGLVERCASIRSIGVLPDLDGYLTGKEEQVFPRLIEEGFRCIEEDGADVICLGSTSMFQAHRALSERLPVPVIDPGPLTYRLAEVALALKLTHSRSAHAAPKALRRDLIDSMLGAAAAEL